MTDYEKVAAFVIGSMQALAPVQLVMALEEYQKLSAENPATWPPLDEDGLETLNRARAGAALVAAKVGAE